jgi:hypothetical protein
MVPNKSESSQKQQQVVLTPAKQNSPQDERALSQAVEKLDMPPAMQEAMKLELQKFVDNARSEFTDEDRKWQTGFGQPGLEIETYFCPCVVWGRTRQRLDRMDKNEDPSQISPSCLSFPCVGCCLGSLCESTAPAPAAYCSNPYLYSWLLRLLHWNGTQRRPGEVRH